MVQVWSMAKTDADVMYFGFFLGSCWFLYVILLLTAVLFRTFFNFLPDIIFSSTGRNKGLILTDHFNFKHTNYLTNLKLLNELLNANEKTGVLEFQSWSAVEWLFSFTPFPNCYCFCWNWVNVNPNILDLPSCCSEVQLYGTYCT